jgi:hypothetical protein
MIGKQLDATKSPKVGEAVCRGLQSFRHPAGGDVAIKILKLNGNLSEKFFKRFELEPEPCKAEPCQYRPVLITCDRRFALHR